MVYRLVLISFLLSSFSFGQNANSDSTEQARGMVYGNDHAFYLTAPRGWVLDNSSGVNQGLYVVFYPKGGSWKTSPAVMYAYTASKKSDGNGTPEKLIFSDILQYKQNYPNVKIQNSPDLQTKDKKIAIIRLFFYSNYESVAYIDEKPITVMLVLTARTEKDFSESFPAFQELVKSYSFLASEVQIHK